MAMLVRRVVCVLALLFGLPGSAGAEEARFDVLLAGVRVAEISLTGTEADGRYAVDLSVRSEGLAGIVARIRFRATAQGLLAEEFVPTRYSEKADTGRRKSDVEMVYDRGVPEVITYVSPRPDGPDLLDPAAQGGTLDPATAMFAGLRDLPAGQNCAVRFDVFDGRRRSTYAQSGEGGVCRGLYRRIAGYTAEEMAERTRFEIEMIYAPEGDGLRVIEASLQTIYGKVRLKRR